MGELFDDISRALASPLPRRRVLRLVVGALVGGSLAGVSAGQAEAAPITGSGRRCRCLIECRNVRGEEADFTLRRRLGCCTPGLSGDAECATRCSNLAAQQSRPGILACSVIDSACISDPSCARRRR